jgi:hypothetical protein
MADHDPNGVGAQRARRLVIAGGLLCFLAMWFPLFPTHSGGQFVPIRDEFGAVCWAWLLVPALALGSSRRRAISVMVMRVVFVLSGLTVGIALVAVALLTFPIVLVVVLPAPILVVVLGAWPARSPDAAGARFTLILAVGALLLCLGIARSEAEVGTAVLAGGALLMFGGGIPWAMAAREVIGDPSLPRAITR